MNSRKIVLLFCKIILKISRQLEFVLSEFNIFKVNWLFLKIILKISVQL